MTLLYILYILDPCYDDKTKTTKACSGSNEDGKCAPATGFCGCVAGFKLNADNNACVNGSYTNTFNLVWISFSDNFER